ncbi:GcrA family cell cycle regulator [Rhodoplanes elegans]|uniref:GcrA family cell cycle regulator n=1 Tax=Rhodoplanes elegans TaxID=29408 RepID=UPI00191482D3|nr:GcrA family cell cycle regulator [Rhodoplanes elegans]
MMLDAIVLTHGEAVSRLWDGQRTPRQIAMAIRGITPYEVGVIVKRLGLDVPKPAPEPAPELAPIVVAPIEPAPVQEPAPAPVIVAAPPAQPGAPLPLPPIRYLASGYVDWDEALEAWIAQEWRAGRSYQEIAEAIGGTRSQVAGKVQRLGLTGRRTEVVLKTRIAAAERERERAEARALAKPPKAPKPARSQQLCFRADDTTPASAEQLAAEQAAAAAQAELAAPDAAFGERCTLLDLTSSTCHWPLGDPGSPDFFFCGGRTAEGLPYCGWHARIAYQPVDRRRDKRQGK